MIKSVTIFEHFMADGSRIVVRTNTQWVDAPVPEEEVKKLSDDLEQVVNGFRKIGFDKMLIEVD